MPDGTLSKCQKSDVSMTDSDGTSLEIACGTSHVDFVIRDTATPWWCTILPARKATMIRSKNPRNQEVGD